MLRGMGSFHIGGRTVAVSGKPVREVLFSPGGVPARVDPNGTYQVEQMYVQYFLAQTRRGAVPMLLWHGGSMTGATWETTPDGRPGWLDAFLRKGWDVYVSDAMERGRSGWAMSPEVFAGEPLFLTTEDPWQRFRIGPERGRPYPGAQFPIEAYGQLMRQFVPRWTTTDAATLAAYLALLDRVGPCVVVCHSQGGMFGLKAAAARPGFVRAVVAVEPAALASDEDAAALRGVPVLMLYGDHIERDARWPAIRANGLGFAETVRAAGGHVDVVDLPDVGLPGNSHFPMMDRNNLDVAALVQGWLVRQALWG